MTGQLHIMPASVDSFPMASFLAVKYGPPKRPAFTSERRSSIFTLYLPDRTLYSGRGNRSTLGVLKNVEPDVFLPITPVNHPHILSGMGYKYMMVLPDRGHNSPYIRRNGEVKIVSDSGGFQMGGGTLDFIDPDKLAAFYAARVDYGIGLDVPLPASLHNTEWLTRMARICGLNNQYLNEVLRDKPVSVYDVSHGLTLEARKEFLDVTLKHQSSDSLAMGGIGQATYDTVSVSRTTAVVNLAYVLTKAKGAYSRFHVLGTTSPEYLTFYNILLYGGVAKYITADSTTYAQGGLAMHARIALYSPDRKERAGVLFPISGERNSWTLPCNCTFCHLVKYSVAYRWLPTLGQLHGMQLMQDQATIVSEYTRQYAEGKITLTHLLEFTTSDRKRFPLIKTLIHFLEEVCESGFDKAYRKYKEKLNNNLRRSEAEGLFGSRRTSKVAQGRIENVTKAIQRYEAYHKKRASGSKKKKV